MSGWQQCLVCCACSISTIITAHSLPLRDYLFVLPYDLIYSDCVLLLTILYVHNTSILKFTFVCIWLFNILIDYPLDYPSRKVCQNFPCSQCRVVLIFCNLIIIMCVCTSIIRAIPSNFVNGGLFRGECFVTFVEISYGNCITSSACIVQQAPRDRTRSPLHLVRAPSTCAAPDFPPPRRYYLGFRNEHQTWKTFRSPWSFFSKYLIKTLTRHHSSCRQPPRLYWTIESCRITESVADSTRSGT